MAMEASHTRRRLVVIVGVFILLLLSNASVQIIGTYMTALSEQFNLGSSMLGLICSLGFAVMCVLGPFSSVIVSRYGYRWAVMGGGTIQAFGMIMSYFVNSTAGLLICLGIIPGIGASMVYVSGPVIIASYFTKRYSTAIGIVIAGIGTGIFILPPLIEELIATYGWRNAILIHGALIFNNAAMGALFRPMSFRDDTCNTKQRTNKVVVNQTENKFKYCEIFQPVNDTLKDSENYERIGIDLGSEKPRDSSKSRRWYPSHLLLVTSTPTIVLVFLTSFCHNAAYSATIVHISNYIVQSDYLESKGALALSLFGIGSIVGRIVHGVPIDANIVAPSTLYELAICFAAAATFLIPIVNTYVGCIVSAICVGLASGVFLPIPLTIMKRMVGTSQLATATGVEMFVDCWAVMAGGYLAGAIRDMTGKYDIVFYTFGATYLIGACCFFPIIILEKRKQTRMTEGDMERETNV